ncbi:MAG: hypothetical protein ABEJ04_07030 [Halobacteriaceae archaeon]
MSAAATSRRARRFVAVGTGFLLVWQAAALAGVSRRAELALGLLGFVLHVVFGKAYALVPTYFDRELAAPRAPALHLPLSAVGAGALGATAVVDAPPVVEALGALAWAAGVAVFLAALGWTVRDNPTGAETGTSEANRERRAVDRAANAFVPVALAYLGLGSYELLAGALGLPSPFGGALPRAAHLLAAGGAGTLLFAVGFRLLPRFLVARPPRPLVPVVLLAGAVGPALVAATLPAGRWFPLAAAVEATAVVGFALAYLALFVRSERRRVGFYGVLAGAAAGTVGVLLGASFVFLGPRPALVAAHLRANLLGFLGLTVVGVSYQFYPPSVGTFPGAGDRTAAAALGGLGVGLLAEVVGYAGGVDALATAGAALALAGAATHCYLVFGLFRERG